MSRPLIDYSDDEIAKIISDHRAHRIVRVRLPDGVSAFVIDPTSHLCVEHVETIERFCDLARDLLARAQKAEALAASEAAYRRTFSPVAVACENGDYGGAVAASETRARAADALRAAGGNPELTVGDVERLRASTVAPRGSCAPCVRGEHERCTGVCACAAGHGGGR